jgi:hypothetical protein
MKLILNILNLVYFTKQNKKLSVNLFNTYFFVSIISGGLFLIFTTMQYSIQDNELLESIFSSPLIFLVFTVLACIESVVLFNLRDLFLHSTDSHDQTYRKKYQTYFLLTSIVNIFVVYFMVTTVTTNFNLKLNITDKDSPDNIEAMVVSRLDDIATNSKEIEKVDFNSMRMNELIDKLTKLVNVLQTKSNRGSPVSSLFNRNMSGGRSGFPVPSSSR